MSEARSLVFPTAIALGARPLAVPGGGNVLVVSAFHAFRLSDDAHVRPSTWYETVADHAGPNAVPDAMVTVPGAELLVIGSVPPVPGDSRKASVRCGALLREVVLVRDPDAPAEPFVPDFEAAAWHGEDNPGGRGGPDDDRPALIVDPNDPARPVWLGATPFDHPMRLRRVGKPDAASGTGWPRDAEPSALYEAHESFWSDSFAPEDPLACEGLGPALDTHLPRYRVTITSGREDGRFVVEPARIHGVTLIPGADVGAVFWRVAIDVGDDMLGESIQALVAALEDVDGPPRDAEHWGRIAVNRWLDPSTAMDDRPLLPAALAATVSLPFAMAEDDPMKARHAAAEDWMKARSAWARRTRSANSRRKSRRAWRRTPSRRRRTTRRRPTPTRSTPLRPRRSPAGKARHAQAGFGERTDDEQQAPEVRGGRLAREIDRRLSEPYGSERDRTIADAVRTHRLGGMEADEILEKLASARQMNPDGAVPWAPMNEEEGRVFGAAVYRHFDGGDPQRHIDISGAILAPGSGAGDGAPESAPEDDVRRIAGRRFDGLFAEDTMWERATFADCVFVASSHCRARFKGCEFRGCEFRETNLSKAEFAACVFIDCTFAGLRLVEPTWYECRFQDSVFEDVALSNAAMRDTVFDGGSWNKLQIADGLLMDMVYRNLSMEEVTLAEVMAPQNRFERIRMTKVWMMGKGPAAGVFEDVEATTCGFLGDVRFDQSTFDRVRFAMTGFTNAIFADARFAANCRFEDCDLSGAMFANATLEGVRFVQCSMAGSKWSNVNASDAWFYGSLLRGVDFGDTDLTRAVFADADLDGVRFLPDKTIGADFRGTVRAES